MLINIGNIYKENIMVEFFATFVFIMGILCGVFITFFFDETETRKALDHKIAMKIKGDLK